MGKQICNFMFVCVVLFVSIAVIGGMCNALAGCTNECYYYDNTLKATVYVRDFSNEDKHINQTEYTYCYDNGSTCIRWYYNTSKGSVYMSKWEDDDAWYISMQRGSFYDDAKLKKAGDIMESISGNTKADGNFNWYTNSNSIVSRW